MGHISGAAMERIYRRHIEAENAQDLDGCMATYHDDCYHEQAAWGEVIRGKPAIRDYYRRIFEMAPGNRVDFEGVATGEDVLVAWAWFSMDLSSGEFMGQKVRPGVHRMHGFTIVPFKEGLMEAERTFPDLLGFARTAGVSLDPMISGIQAATAA